jgi:hypothetical protein
MTLLMGNGDGTFSAPGSFPNSPHLASPSIVVADFDHDGKLDVVIGHQISCFTAPCTMGRTISLLRGNGVGNTNRCAQIKDCRPGFCSEAVKQSRL